MPMAMALGIRSLECGVKIRVGQSAFHAQILGERFVDIERERYRKIVMMTDILVILITV